MVPSNEPEVTPVTRFNKYCPDEAPRGTRESTRTSSDGVHFHNRDDIGVLRWSAESDNVSEEVVSVGRCEDTGPEGLSEGQEVDLELIGQGKATKMGSVPRPARIHKQFGELDVGDFNSLDGAVEGYPLRCRRGAGKRRCQQQRCHLQIEDGFHDGFHITFCFLIVVFLFRGPTKPARPRPIRVCEGQRPFNHSCAVEREKSYHSKGTIFMERAAGSVPSVGLLSPTNH